MKTLLSFKTQPLLFTLRETAGFCHMDVQILRQWVAQGRITPAIPAGSGQHHGHRFSPQQLIGLTIVVWLCNSGRGCSPAYATKVLDHFSKMPDDALDYWVGPSGDEHGDESLANWRQAVKLGLANPNGPVEVPDDKERQDEINRRLDIVEAAIRFAKEIRDQESTPAERQPSAEPQEPQHPKPVSRITFKGQGS